MHIFTSSPKTGLVWKHGAEQKSVEEKAEVHTGMGQSIDSVTVIGLDHHLQNWRPPQEPRSKERNGLRVHFKLALLGILERLRSPTVYEEADHSRRSIAEEICLENGLKFKNFDLTHEERERFGMPLEYELNETFRVSIALPPLTEQQIYDIRKKRDECLVQRITCQLKECNGGDAVIICGREHIISLCKASHAFSEAIFSVDLTEYQWFDPDLF